MNKIYEKLASMKMSQVLGVGIVAAVFYFFMAYDDGASIKAQMIALNKQIEQELVKKQDTEATLKQETLMKENISKLNQQYIEVSKRLPSTLFSIDINRAIDTFARTASVDVKTKKPGTPVKTEVIDEIPVEVSLEGDYSELAQFVYFVSTAEKLTRVKSFVISKDDKKGSVKLKFEGQVVGYKLGTGTEAKKR